MRSDHQPNIGIERTYGGPTIYSYARIGMEIPNIEIAFTETNAARIGLRMKTQTEAISEIESFIASTTNQPHP